MAFQVGATVYVPITATNKQVVTRGKITRVHRNNTYSVYTEVRYVIRAKEDRIFATSEAAAACLAKYNKIREGDTVYCRTDRNVRRGVVKRVIRYSRMLVRAAEYVVTVAGVDFIYYERQVFETEAEAAA